MQRDTMSEECRRGRGAGWGAVTLLIASLLAAFLSFSSRGVAAPPSATDPPPTNAAELYGKAFELMRFGPDDSTNRLGMTRDEWDRLNNIDGPHAMTLEDRELLRRVRPLLDLVGEAGSLPKADFGLDRSQGHQLLLPHLSQMRSLSRVMRCEAWRRVGEGDVDAAIGIMEAQAGMSSHLGGDSVLISSLVSRALAQINDGLIEECLDRGVLDAEGAARVAAALGRLDSDDPFRIGDAVGSEAEMFEISVGAAIDRGDRAEFAQAAQMIGQGFEPLAELDPEALEVQLATTRSLYAEVERAFANPNPEAARAALAQITTRIEDGEGGELARMFMSNFDRIYEMKLEGDRLIKDRRAMLLAIAEGRLEPQSVANAAMWYRLAARAAVTIPEDEQATLEAFRVTLGAVDETVRVEARRIIDRHRKAVIEPLLAGSRCGRCDFRAANGSPPPTVVGLPEYAPGLRAAARLLMVEQILGSSAPAADASLVPTAATKSTPSAGAAFATPALVDPEAPAPDPIAENWIALIRVVGHVTGDSKVAHAVLAQSIFADGLQVATWQTGRWTPVEPWRERLEDTLGSFDRGDPVGHRRGLVADRAVMARSYLYPADPDDPPDPKRAALESTDGATMISVGLLLQHGVRTLAPFSCGPRPEAVLLDMRDLYDPFGCAELREHQATIWRSPMLAGILELRPGAPPFGIDPVPVVVDVALMAPEAPSLLAAWEKLFARRAASSAAP